MTISFVVAVAEDGAMGRNNELPWRLSADLQHFKKTTLGKPVVMGRKTWESLGGKPLPKRTNVVLSSQPLLLPEGVRLYKNLDAVLKDLSAEDEICIIGGAQIFEAAMPLADVLHLTRVHTAIPDADVFFPEPDWNGWELVGETAHPADAQNQYAFTMQRWERKSR